MKKKEFSNSSLTVLTIVVGLGVVYLITRIDTFLFTFLTIGILAIASKWLREKINFFWGLITKLLSYFVPNILLSLIFYLFLTPVAYLAKIFGKKDPLKLKNKYETVFIEEEKHFDKRSFENMF